MRRIALILGISLLLSTSIAYSQTCTQAITLRSGVCPSGATSCTSKGASLSWAELDADLINVANICNAVPTSFVSSVVAGTGIAVTGTSTPTVALNYSDTLASNSLTAGQCEFISSGAGGVLCEGSGVDAFETFLTFTDPTVDRTITFPNVTGTVITTGDLATVANGMLASSYSGVGACGANLWESGSNANAAPTCTQINYTNLAGSVPATISSSSGSSIVTATPATAFTLTEDESNATGVSITGKKSRGAGSASVSDTVRQDNYQILNSASSASNVVIAKAVATGVTSGAEQADYTVQVRQAGALTTMLTLSGAGTASMPEPITIYQPTIGSAGVAKSSHVISTGTAPAVSCTGTGTGGSSSVVGTDAAAVITLSIGTSPVAVGTCTLTFNSAYVTNMPVCVTQLVSGSGSWSTSAPQPAITTESLTAPQITWNNTLNLTASTTYKIAVVCIGK